MRKKLKTMINSEPNFDRRKSEIQDFLERK
jgi:hypothetical protein